MLNIERKNLKIFKILNVWDKEFRKIMLDTLEKHANRADIFDDFFKTFESVNLTEIGETEQHSSTKNGDVLIFNYIDNQTTNITHNTCYFQIDNQRKMFALKRVGMPIFLANALADTLCFQNNPVYDEIIIDLNRGCCLYNFSVHGGINKTKGSVSVPATYMGNDILSSNNESPEVL